MRSQELEEEDAQIRLELGQSLLLVAMAVITVGIALMVGVVVL